MIWLTVSFVLVTVCCLLSVIRSERDETLKAWALWSRAHQAAHQPGG
jgi:hypothetical protein